MNCGVSSSTLSGGIPRDAANARSLSSIWKSGGILVPRASFLLSFFSLTTTRIASSFFSLIIQDASAGFPVDSGGSPVEFVDARLRLFRSRSQARRLSIVEVSTGLTVETALAAIASSSVSTARMMNSTGIPFACISEIIVAIGVAIRVRSSRARPYNAQGSPQPLHAWPCPVF
jgi:hypothetical protein